jgi:hypothetical protein
MRVSLGHFFSCQQFKTIVTMECSKYPHLFDGIQNPERHGVIIMLKDGVPYS